MPPALRDDDELFATVWAHVFEEHDEAGLVFRPDGPDIPRSRRPRLRLSFSRDGKATASLPGPDDRPQETPATWEADGDVVRVRVPRGPGGGAKDLSLARAGRGRLIGKG